MRASETLVGTCQRPHIVQPSVSVFSRLLQRVTGAHMKLPLKPTFAGVLILTFLCCSHHALLAARKKFNFRAMTATENSDVINVAKEKH